MNIFLGIPMLSIYYPELVKDWECWDALGEVLHHTALIPFTQLILVLSWIIVAPCGIAAQSVTARLGRGFKDVPQKLFLKIGDSDKALEYLKRPSLVTRRGEPCK